MPTRREILFGACASAVVMHARDVLAEPSQPGTPVSFDVPPGARDCHTHIHRDPATRRKILVDNPARLYGV